MKKDVNKKNKSLKKLKEELITSFDDKDYELCIKISEKLIKLFSKNIIGYVYYIKASTNNYSKYLKEEELKTVKEIYEKALKVANENEKVTLKKDFDDYLYDLKEVENLGKIKKEITGKLFLKESYKDILTNLNHNINVASSYDEKGIRIKNIYDFLNGLFLILCLIFNLIYRNYLLILTIPFGIFGIITIYSFLDMNFFSKGKLKTERKNYLDLLENEKEKIIELKKEIQRINDSLIFLNEQKTNSICKIPESFKESINNLIVNDEKNKAKCILECLVKNNMALFTSMLESETNLNMDEIYNKGKYFLMKNSKLLNYINDKNNEKKDKHNTIIYMKKITTNNIIVLLITLIISFLSIVLIINNFYEFSFISFVISVIIGILSILIYNIETGKKSSVFEIFKGNLLYCIFNSSLVYNLIYSAITNNLSFTYGFIQMPIIFAFVFIGFSMLVSLLKYTYLLKKLRS